MYDRVFQGARARLWRQIRERAATFATVTCARRQRHRRGLAFSVSGRAMAHLVRMPGAPTGRARAQDQELLRLAFDALISDSPEARKAELRGQLIGEIRGAMPLLASPWPAFEAETPAHLKALQLSTSICATLVPTPMSPPMARSLDHRPIARVRRSNPARLTRQDTRFIRALIAWVLACPISSTEHWCVSQ